VSDFFISIYMDEDVSLLVTELVRLKNFRALSVNETDRKGKSDAEQLDFATENGCAILTHNRRDFEALAHEYFMNEWTHAGIIISVQRPPRLIVEKLFEVLNDLTADEMKNQIIYI